MPQVAVNVAVVHEGQILLTQREDFEVWCLPSGEVEPGESLAQAAVRETLEETGIEVELTRLVGVYSRQGAFLSDVHAVLFAARPVGGTLRLQPGETVAVRYFGPERLPADLSVGHRQRIADALSGAEGRVWQQRLEPPTANVPRREWYARRDRSGLSRVEFYRRCMAGRQLVERLEVEDSGPPAAARGGQLSVVPLCGIAKGAGPGVTGSRPELYVNVAIVQGGRILLLQREDYEVWCVPGGRVEEGESLVQAAVREAREETGLEVRLTGLVGVYSLLGLAGDGHAVLFAGETGGGALQPQSGEALDLRYFAADGIPGALFAGHRQRSEDALNGVRAVSWRQEFVPRLFVGVKSRQEVYALRDRSGLPRAQFYRDNVALSRLEEVLEVGAGTTQNAGGEV